MKPLFVLDCSMAMAWCFADETDPKADRVLDDLNLGLAVAPSIWPLEVVNVLLIAERRKRIDYAGMQRALVLLATNNIEIDSQPIQRHWARLLDLARDQQLTAYDASYLDLALRAGLPLATLDRDLIRAAPSLGVPIYASGSAGA